jgi:hypothetical protein
MTWTVDVPEEPSVYEQFVGHRLDMAEYGATKHFVHPDECEDCKDPATHAEVQKNMDRINRSIDNIRPFFSEDIPHDLLLNIGMSFFMGFNEAETVNRN